MNKNEALSEQEIKKAKEARRHWIVYKIIFPSICAMVVFDKLFPEECIEQAQVVDIVSVEGSKATFKFSNGKTEKISYGNLKRGDTYCLARERKNKYFNW